MWTIYRHAKGMLYLHLGTALHSESCEPMEVYRTLYDNDMAPVWARPQPMFHEEVSPGQKRFTEVGRVRTMMPEDESAHLEFGYDAWGGGLSRAEFVNAYKTDPNHLRGTRYLLESPSGEPIGNLNTLRFARGLVGIASVSVNPVLRGRGHGSTLVRAVMELLRGEDPATRFILFSEVNPAMYERLGFRQIDEAYQFHRPSIAMISGDAGVADREIRCLRTYF
jgi:ribosomal protein S18 acetylase RimI-like enzyme